MIETTEIHRIYNEDSPVSHHPAPSKVALSLTMLGVGLGAGALTYGLLKLRAQRQQSTISKIFETISDKVAPKRAFKTAVGSLVLRELRRRLKSKLR